LPMTENAGKAKQNQENTTLHGLRRSY